MNTENRLSQLLVICSLLNLILIVEETIRKFLNLLGKGLKIRVIIVIGLMKFTITLLLMMP